MERPILVSTAISILALVPSVLGADDPAPEVPVPPEIVLVAGESKITGIRGSSSWSLPGGGLIIACGHGVVTAAAPVPVDGRIVSLVARGKGFRRATVMLYAVVGAPDTFRLRSGPGDGAREPLLSWIRREAPKLKLVGHREVEDGEPVHLSETSLAHQPVRDLPAGRYVIEIIADWEGGKTGGSGRFFYFVEIT